jgi:hypothetical protein
MSTQNETDNSTVEEVTTTQTTETTEQPKTETTTTEETVKPKTAPEFVPLTLEDIPLPEGLEALPEAQTKFLDIVNDQSMSPKDRAQKLVALQAEVMQTASERISSLWTQQQETWQNEVRADPAYNTEEKLATSLDRVSKFIDEYGTPEVREILSLTGAGNNLHLLRMIDKAAATLAEGKPTLGAPPTSSGNPDEDRARRLYPSMKS